MIFNFVDGNNVHTAGKVCWLLTVIYPCVLDAIRWQNLKDHS